MEIKEINQVSKCNEIVTYYSFLTPQYMDEGNLFLNPKFHCILSNIEKATNCIIKTRRLLCSELPGIRNTDARNSGFWLTEMYYHQIYGRHDVALRMIDSSMKICASVKYCSLHRTSLKTKKGQFPIEDQDILRRMTSSSKSMGSKLYRESFSKIESQDKTKTVSKNIDNETLDFGTKTGHKTEIRESESFTTYLSNVLKTNDGELNNEDILTPVEPDVLVSINNVEANQENVTEFKDSSILLKRSSEDKNILVKTDLEEINKSDSELNNIKNMYNDYLPESFSKIQSQDKIKTVSKNMDYETLDFGTETVRETEINVKELNRESEIYTTDLSNVPKKNDGELNYEYILTPAELDVPLSINNAEANQEDVPEVKDSSSLLKRDSEDKNILVKPNLEKISKSDSEYNNIKNNYDDYIPFLQFKYDESMLSSSKLEHMNEDLMKELVMEVENVNFPIMTQLSFEVLNPLPTLNSFGKVTIVDLDVDAVCPTVGAAPSAELCDEYLPNISTQFDDVSYSLTEQDKSIYVELIYDEMKINAEETKKMVSHRINDGKDRMITFGSVRIIKSAEYNDEDMKTSSQIDDSDINNDNFFSLKDNV